MDMFSLRTLASRAKNSVSSVLAKGIVRHPQVPASPLPEAAEIKQEELAPTCVHEATGASQVFRDGLPMELWFLVVSMALQPRFATSQAFLPQDIQSFYISLIVHQFSCPDKTELKKTRLALRLVCKTFRSIVDKISLEAGSNIPGWIQSYSPDNAENYPPAARLDTRFRNLSGLANIEKQYPYDARTISVSIEFMEELKTIPTVSLLLVNPWALKVLHISFQGSFGDRMHPISTEMVEGLPCLQILSFSSPWPVVLKSKMSLPKLKALFLSIKPHDASDLSEWNFPNLEHLAIDSRGWPWRFHGSDSTVPRVYQDLINRHKDRIRSLMLLPKLGNTFDSHDTYFRRNALPSFETLAIDLVDSIIQPLIPFKAREATIEHLIHISTRQYTRTQVASALLNAIKLTPSVKSVSFIEDAFTTYGIHEDGDENGWEATELLNRACKERGIRVLGFLGVEYCCVLEAFRRLSKAPLPKTHDPDDNRIDGM